MKRNRWIEGLLIATVAAMMSGCGDASPEEDSTTTGNGGNCPAGDEIWHKGTMYCAVTSPRTGKVWLDRNLGASKACDDYNDTACFGDYYQWGRHTDGHEKSTSKISSAQANDINNAGNKFITSSDIYANDWAKAADGDGALREANWFKTDGSSVCPEGYRVPYFLELEPELMDNLSPGHWRMAGSSNDFRVNAANSFLKLPSAGGRYNVSGKVLKLGESGVVWSSYPHNFHSARLKFISDIVGINANDDRADGCSVRCVKD